MNKKFLILPLLLLIGLTSFAQEDNEDYNSEFVWGINKNTSGGLIGGFTFRKSRKIGDDLFESVGLELMNVKHNQETQLRTQAGSSFIFGKVNYLYALRFQYGRELILFRKAPQQGVEIKAITAIGPSIGVLAPYYIEYSPDGNSTIGGNTERVPYDPAIHSIERIIGTGYLFQGIQESNLRIGANLKAGLSFEMGTLKSSVTGVEIGALLDAYTQKIDLMAGVENRAIFPTAYITIFYGTRR
ncbi:MAG: hypothetical protein RLO81_11750 [Fulvivirga sp.]|uniref:hypothetical protein n=1 Tax=Fulvivirga sp. TaxID=1931237 RepID=UPI0032EEDC5E